MKPHALTVVCFCFLAISGYSQNQSIEDEFSERLGRANALRDSSTYRATIKSEHFASQDNTGQISDSEIREVIPPDLWRSIKTTTNNGKKRKVEQIGENGTFYERINDGPWTMYRGGTGDDPSSQTIAQSDNYKYVGQVKQRGQLTDLYEIRSERSIRSAGEGQPLVRSISITKYWFLKDGHLLQTTRESSVQGRSDFDRLITTYEYEPKDVNFKLPIP